MKKYKIKTGFIVSGNKRIRISQEKRNRKRRAPCIKQNNGQQ